MNRIKLFLSILILFPFAGSGQSTQNDFLGKSPVVGKRIKNEKGELISVEQSSFKSTIRVPLSALIEELKIIPLEDHDDALIGNVSITMSDTYILGWRKDQNPFKLFDKKGKYISTIGAYGEGPNEYQNVYDAQIDEKNNRIGLLPWLSSTILCYDLQGNNLPPIRLPQRVPKGKFKFLPDGKSVAVVTLPFPDTEAVAWVQDFEGNIISSVPTGHLALPRDFSNEVYSARNGSDFDINLLCIVPTPRADSLYHFDTEKGKLIPRFTFNFKEDPLPWHDYFELPGYFYGGVSYPVKESEYITVGSKPKHYIVSKESLKGSYALFVNDYWGNIEIWPSFSNGYFTQNYEPLSLIEKIEEALASKEISDKAKKELTTLKNSIDDNGNNYIIYGKLKRGF